MDNKWELIDTNDVAIVCDTLLPSLPTNKWEEGYTDSLLYIKEVAEKNQKEAIDQYIEDWYSGIYQQAYNEGKCAAVIDLISELNSSYRTAR